MESQPLISPTSNRGIREEEKSFFHPTRAAFRYAMLFVISSICFGSYFTYDEIQPSQYRDAFHGYMTQGRFGVLYSVYSIPNTILVFFGGILGDKIGLRLAGMIFVILCVVGSSVVALGSTLIGLDSSFGISPAQGFILTVVGRIVFGCGAESLNVIQNSMISRWFSGGRELAFAMGLSLSMCRLGDLFALSGTVYVYSWLGNNFNYILWLGFLLCLVALVSVIVYSIIDKATEHHFPSRVVDPSENELNFKAVLSFDLRFWLIAVVCTSYYGAIFPFIAICNNYLVQPNTYNLGASEASILSGVITLSSMFLSPFLGKFLDIVARRPYFVAIGSAAVIPAHLWLANTLPYPVIPIVIMGISFSLVPSALWPAIPLVTKPKEVATAFGVMAAIQNTGLAIINPIAGVIANSSYGYKGSMYFFVLMDCIGLFFAICLVITDLRRGKTLITPKPKDADKSEVVNHGTGNAITGEPAAGGIINY